MEKKLYLIDGHALIFKMYYAFFRRPMINSKGADTSILFGFTKHILELIDREKPSHIAIAFDPPGGTFRHEMYADYKGTRQETPQLVIDSLEPLCELCNAMKIPVLMVKGFEADDVIGSMAKRAEKEGFQVYMVTPDKDYGQLISPNIIQYKPGKSGSERELIDVQAVCEKYGINTPEQVIEILTICGDSSDNVPGVKGVGEVGASKLIGKYGTVENIYANIDQLTPKQREAFENSRGHIGLSHDLVTIKTDIQLDIKTEDMAVTCQYDSQVADLFEKYEFGSLRKFLGNIQPCAPKVEKKLSFKDVDAKTVCKIAKEKGCCAIYTDYEQAGPFGTIKQITVAVNGEGEECLTSCGRIDSFKEIITDASVIKYGYDLKAQYNTLTHNEAEPQGRLMDIELMHYLVNPEKSHKLDILSKAYLGINIDEQSNQPKEEVMLSLFDEVPEEEECVSHSAEAAATLLLGEKIWEEMGESNLQGLYSTMEEPLMKVLARMEHEGVKIDLAQLRKYAAELGSGLNDIQEDIRNMADEPGLNIMSPQQIGTVLFEKLKLDPKIKIKKGKSSYPTDEETLSALADRHPIINQILEFRGIKKLLSTYIEPLPGYVSSVTGKIHTTFNQALTATGRLSSSKPNLQNIPIRTERGKEIRKAFISSRQDGVIVSADYSQIELRIMAHLSCDSHLISAFRNGQDVHAMTAAKIFGIDISEVTADQRRIAKTANFGIMYGISAFGLSQRLGISRSEAKKIIEDYFEKFPAISSFIEYTLTAARENGYVETLFGRRRYLPDINSHNGTVRALAERTAVNAPIQGTSADIIKLAMINVDKRIREEGLKSRMVLQIHDELVFDAVKEELETLRKIVVEEMENVIELSIPLTVECNYGTNWLEAH